MICHLRILYKLLMNSKLKKIKNQRQGVDAGVLGRQEFLPLGLKHLTDLASVCKQAYYSPMQRCYWRNKIWTPYLKLRVHSHESHKVPGWIVLVNAVTANNTQILSLCPRKKRVMLLDTANQIAERKQGKHSGSYLENQHRKRMHVLSCSYDDY